MNSSRALGLSKLDVTDLQVRVAGDRAYASYRYVNAGTPTTDVTSSDPDVYVRIGEWYDEHRHSHAVQLS